MLAVVAASRTRGEQVHVHISCTAHPWIFRGEVWLDHTFKLLRRRRCGAFVVRRREFRVRRIAVTEIVFHPIHEICGWQTHVLGNASEKLIDFAIRTVKHH